MEAKAKELGQGGKLFYMNPNNAHWLKPDDAAKVEAIGVKDHAVMDIHLGGGGGVEMAENMFNTYPNYTMGAVNAETNAGIHTMTRAMMEATDLNDWFNCAEKECTRLHFRTASFCDERSGHYGAQLSDTSSVACRLWLTPPRKQPQTACGHTHGIYTAPGLLSVRVETCGSHNGNTLVAVNALPAIDRCVRSRDLVLLAVRFMLPATSRLSDAGSAACLSLFLLMLNDA